MEHIATRVRQVFADLTRYPVDILDFDADLEMDLGIDSVKRAEIFAVLAKQFNLPPVADLTANVTWTIGSIASAIEKNAKPNGIVHAATPPPRPGPAITLPPPPAEIPVPAAKNGHDSAEAVNRAKIAAMVRELDPQAMQSLFNIVQEALGSKEPAAAAAVGHNAAAAAAPVAFLPTSHRPFAGKIALVTGSGRGLGKAMANQLADLGARVIVNSFFSRERGEQVTADINARGGDAIHLWGSVANPKQLAGIMEEIDRRYGGLDFLVQNASNGLIAPIDQINETHWEKAFRTNVVALHQAALLALPLMKRRGGGKIVALSSPGAHSHIEHFGCIGPVKAAVESLVVYLAVELGQFNIQVNALSAGPLYGELMDSYPDSKRLVQHWEARAPDHRLGQEREISNVMMFLLSDLANKTSGSVMLVDGASSRRL
jgi:enoyl-[acyl-carrier protein] reductase III